MIIKSAFRWIVSCMAFPVPVKWWIKVSGINVIYPFYHIIADSAPSHVKHLYKVRSIKQFRRDMDFLTTHFKSINTIPNNPLHHTHNSFFLSFDDGLSECYDVIAPILEEYNFKATFFVNTDYIDNKDLFYKYKSSIILDRLSSLDPKDKNSENVSVSDGAYKEKTLVKKLRRLPYSEQHLPDVIADRFKIDFSEFLLHIKPYMGKVSIEALIKKGHRIGSHGKGHCLFSEISLEKQKEEIIESLKYLETEFKVKYKCFAFPFTDHNVGMELFGKIKAEQIVDYSFGTAGMKKDQVPFNIQRIPIEKYASSAERTIKTEYALYMIKKLFGINTIRRG